ncbi:MAG: RNA polymerase sporulation sigma factor SigE [Candidatus Fimivivens sp.]|jgi:RNA polymerase sporulation-specific sigma factor|nr:sigE [Oscillospiraceae bacterium]MEA5135310.1 RNA polymerase sporulation sigma factor SigE [Candidatus Fimivivens sp.]
MKKSVGTLCGALRLQLYLILLRLGFTEAVHYIHGPETLPAPLSREEERVIFIRLEQKDHEARQQLIVHNLRLVVYIARKFESSGLGVEDLISIGTIGLIKAVNTFCPSRGIKLATYASRCIENEILMYLRKCQPLKNEVSIDEPLNIDWDGNELLLSDVLGTEPDSINRPIEQDAEKSMLADAINKLCERERLIMQLRFGFLDGKERTQKQVADMIGISQSYISRLEKRIIKRLRRDLDKVM